MADFQAAIPTAVRDLRRSQHSVRGEDVLISDIGTTTKLQPWAPEEVLQFCIAFNKCVPRTMCCRCCAVRLGLPF